MLNKLITFLLLMTFAFSANIIAQETETALPIDQDTQLITYQEVVQQPGTADELYIRCIEWINTYYKNPSDVCRIRNRESGVIEILHRFEVTKMDGESKLVAGIVNYSLKLEFKPGRYRYSVTDLTLKQSSRYPIEKWMDKSDKLYSPEFDDFLKQINTQVNDLITSLKTGMEPPVIKVEEKW